MSRDRLHKMPRNPRKQKLFTCPNCDGGLRLEDPSYGLVCPACEIRVAGPFESAHEIPDYLPAKEPRRKAQATNLSLVRAVLDGAAATLLDRFDLEGVTVPTRIDRTTYPGVMSALGFVADIVDPKDPDPVVQQFVRDYTALVKQGLASRPRSFR